MKKDRNQKIFDLARKGMSLGKLAKRFEVSRSRVYTIIIEQERNRNHSDHFGNLTTRHARSLVKEEVISLHHAKLLGLDKLMVVKGIGPVTAARIMVGDYDL